MSEFRPEPVHFDFEHITRTEPRETTSTVSELGESRTIPTQTLGIVIPMTGDSELLRRQASTRSMGPTPQALLLGDAVAFSVTGPSLTAQQVKSQVQRFQDQITQMTEWANGDVRAWDAELRASETTATNDRRQRLDQAASLSAALDIPLAPADSSRQIHVPVARKTLRVERATSGPREEPRLADAIYEDVVQTISSLARAMERLPLTAARFDEEELRDLVLFVLNSNYEGAARGEVFNGKGKTDILLTWKDRNAFIGECKVWGGPAKFSDAIDQLLGYVVWRDTKAALLLFIRRGEPTRTIEKADAAIRAHPSFRSAGTPHDPDMRRDYLMTAKDDPERFIKLALLPVVLPSG